MNEDKYYKFISENCEEIADNLFKKIDELDLESNTSCSLFVSTILNLLFTTVNSLKNKNEVISKITDHLGKLKTSPLH